MNSPRRFENSFASLLSELVEEVVTSDAVLELLRNQPICYSLMEAADLLHCSPRRLQTAVARGELIGARIGRSLTFTREELVRFRSTYEC